MRKLPLAATAAAAASALVFTSAGVSSAAQAHQASPATQSRATLTASTTPSGDVYVASFSCPLSLTGLAAVACALGVQEDMLAAELQFQANQLNAATFSGFVVGTGTGNGVQTWTLWAVPAAAKTGLK